MVRDLLWGKRRLYGNLEINFKLQGWGERASEIFVVEGPGFSAFPLPVSYSIEVGRVPVPKHNPLYFVGGFVSLVERWMCS